MQRLQRSVRRRVKRERKGGQSGEKKMKAAHENLTGWF